MHYYALHAVLRTERRSCRTHTQAGSRELPARIEDGGRVLRAGRTCLPWMRNAPCKNASSVLKMALLISWEDGHAKLPTGYQPPLIAPSSSVAPTLRKKTLNSGEPPSLSFSYVLAACAHRRAGAPHAQACVPPVKMRPLTSLGITAAARSGRVSSVARTERARGQCQRHTSGLTRAAALSGDATGRKLSPVCGPLRPR